MTSKIVVNNIEADAGVSTVTFNSNVVRGGSNLHSTGLALGAGSTVGAVTGVTTYYGDGSQLTNLSAANLTGALPAISGANLTGLNSDVVSDTSPQLGGNLDVNSKNINFGDSSGSSDDRLNFGADTDLSIYHNGTNNIISSNTSGKQLILSANSEVRLTGTVTRVMDENNTETCAVFQPDGAVELYHDNRLRAYTVSNAFYVEQSELNDDCDVLVNNKSTTIGNNQKSQISCRVARDAGGSHGGTNRTATFGHNYNSSTGGGGFFTIRSNDGTHRDFYMDNNTNLRVNYGHSNIGTTNGTVVGSQSSDIRNKNLVGDGTVSYGLSEVLQLNPIKYQYKKELVDRIGFSAQQVEPIIPESVYDTKQDQDNEGNTVSGDTIKAMYYVDLIPVLVNAIKELKAENDALKKRLDDGGL